MKNSLLFVCLFFSIAAAAQDAAQLIGTWRATYVEGTGLFRTQKQFMFSFYPDGRMYNVENGEQFNGTWKIEGKLVLNYWDNGNVGKAETTYFQNGTWNYTGLGDEIQYSATKVSSQPSVIPLIYFNINRTPAPPVGNVINVTQLVGHWKATTSSNETLEFNIYPDQRAYTVDNSGSQNTCWTIKNEYFLSYEDYLMPSEPAVLKTTFFDGKTWKYESLENGIKFTATKTGNTSQKIALRKKVISPPPPPPPPTCLCCGGTGLQDCPICYGEGGKNERVARTTSYGTDYYNVWHQCEYCYGRGKTKCKCSSH